MQDSTCLLLTACMQQAAAQFAIPQDPHPRGHQFEVELRVLLRRQEEENQFHWLLHQSIRYSLTGYPDRTQGMREVGKPTMGNGDAVWEEGRSGHLAASHRLKSFPQPQRIIFTHTSLH